MVDQVSLKPTEKKGFFERLSFFQKALLFLAVLIVLFLAVAIVFGGIKSLYEFFFYLTIFVIIIVGVYIVIQATNLIFQPTCIWSFQPALRRKCSKHLHYTTWVLFTRMYFVFTKTNLFLSTKT